LINTSIPLYIQNMIFLTNDNIYSLIYGSRSITLLDSFIAISLLILGFYTIKNILNNRSNTLYFLFVSSLLITFIFYVGSGRSTYIDTATRYLTYSGISIFALISSAYNKNIKLYLLLIFVLLISGAYSNFDFVAMKEIQTNMNEFDLINYLSENNLTYGYGDYADSNLITYLSHEKIVVRPIFLINATIYPFRFLSSERWFNSLSEENKEYFIISRRDNVFLKPSSIDAFIAIHSPKQQLIFREFIIYIFEGNGIKFNTGNAK
jgi:hypothetical protein